MYFESRLIKAQFADGLSREDLDQQAAEVTEGLDADEKSLIQQKVLQLNAVYGAPEHEDNFSPPLDPDELAFYDAVASNPSAVEIMGDEDLAFLARKLLALLKADARTDWTKSDQVRARLRTSVKRLLRQTGYPPDKSADATRLIIEQMEALAPRYS